MLAEVKPINAFGAAQHSTPSPFNSAMWPRLGYRQCFVSTLALLAVQVRFRHQNANTGCYMLGANILCQLLSVAQELTLKQNWLSPQGWVRQ